VMEHLRGHPELLGAIAPAPAAAPKAPVMATFAPPPDEEE
jgi:hypothetical protein